MSELSRKEWAIRLAIKCGLGYVALIVLTGGPLPKWLWRLIDATEGRAK